MFAYFGYTTDIEGRPLLRGCLYLVNKNDNEFTFLVLDREENGLADPDPKIVRVTQQSISVLPVRQLQDIVNDRQKYEVFSVFGRLICWERRAVYEGAFAGTTIFFHGPYHVVTPEESVL